MAADVAIAAFYAATRENEIETVAQMLDEDPRLLSSVWEGETPLSRAIRGRHVGMVRLLLDRGFEVNTVDADRATALHHAANQGCAEVVSLLLASGADANRVERKGWTALMYAAFLGHVGVVRLLLRHVGGCGLDVRSDGGGTALYTACVYGRADVVQALLLGGADHTIAAVHGGTPRQIAQWNNHHQCVALIQRWKAEPRRAYVLHKARTLHEDTTTHQQAPAAPVPAYLRTRVQADNAMPSVEVGATEQGGEEGAAKREREEGGQEEEDELCAMVQYVVKGLNGQLYTELMQGFRR